MTCSRVWCPILWICALHLTHPSAHTQQQVVNTHTEQWAAIFCCGAQGWIVGSLHWSRVSPHLVVLKVKALVIHSRHLQSVSVPRLEPKSNSLTIRTQLAPSYWRANILHSLAPTSSNTLALTFLVILNQGRCQGEAFAGPAPLPFLWLAGSSVFS